MSPFNSKSLSTDATQKPPHAGELLLLLRIAAVSENEGFLKKNGAPFGDV